MILGMMNIQLYNVAILMGYLAIAMMRFNQQISPDGHDKYCSN